MTQFGAGLFREQIQEAREPEEQPAGDFSDGLMDDLAARSQPRASPYAEAIMDGIGGGQTTLDQVSGFLEEMGIQEPDRGDPDVFRTLAEGLLGGPLGELYFSGIGQFSEELAKSLVRGGINIAVMPIDFQIANMRASRIITAKLLGKPLSEIPQLKTERAALDARFELEEVVREGFLAPKQQDRIFAWDDPDWWAGQAGEAFVFLMTSLATGVAAGSIAKAAGFSNRMVGAVRVAAGASTAGLLEANVARADFVAALMEKGLTEDEAFIIADQGAAAVGLVNGLLEVVPMTAFLGTGQSRHLIVRALTRMGSEAVTETVQEGTIITAERKLGIDQPGTELERMMAAGSVGGVVGAPVSFGPGLTGTTVEARAPTAVAELNVTTAAEAREARKQILGKGEPLTDEEQELIDVSRHDVQDRVLQELQSLNEKERAVAREVFSDIADSGLNPFTNEVMNEDEIAGMRELLADLDTVQEAIPEEPDESFTTPEEGREDVEAQAPPEAEPTDQESRQEAEEDQKQAVAQVAEEAEEAEPAAGEQPVEQPDTFRESLDRVAKAFPEELSEPISQIHSLDERIRDLLDQGLMREAAPLLEETAALKAGVIAELDRLQSIHGVAGGQFAAAARSIRSRSNTAEASVERMVITVRNIPGQEQFEASVAQVDPDSPEGGMVREARRIGLRLVYFDTDSDAVRGGHDLYGDGRTVMLNAALPLAIQTQSVFSHEVVHVLRMSSEAVWEKFYQRISVVDPDGLKEAGRSYWDSISRGKGNFQEWFDSDQGRSESMARYVEDRALDTDFYNRVVGNDRNLLTMIRDVARRLAEVLGLAGVDTKALLEVGRLADEAARAIKAPVAAGVKVGNVFVGKTQGRMEVVARKGDSISLRLENGKVQKSTIGTLAETLAKGLVAPEGPAAGIVDQEGQITDQVNLALRGPRQPRGRGMRRRVERVTGVKKGTVTEQELRQLRRVFKEQRKVGEQAFREGLSEAQGRVLGVLEGVFGKIGTQATERQIKRMQKARAARSPQQVFAEGIRLMEDQIRLIRMEMVEDVRAQKMSIRKVKRQITDAVKRNLKGPIGRKMQGRFLGDVARAETATQLHIAMKRIEVAIGQMNFRQAAADLTKVERKARKFKPMTNDMREQIEGISSQARTLTRTETGRLQAFKTRAEYDQKSDALFDAVDAIEALLAIRRAERNQINADRARTKEGHVTQIEENTSKLKQLKGRSKTVQDKVTGWVRTGKIALLDIANLSRYAEGKWKEEGVLAALLDRVPKEVEENHNNERRNNADETDRLVRENTGYRNLAEAQMRLQGTLGEANQEFAEVTIGGERVSLALDVIGELLAVDNRTLAGIVKSGFQPEGARQTEPLRPTLAEMQDIRAEWGPKFGNLIVGMKAKIETLKPRTFSVVKELKGREPRPEPPGYWPSTRNITASPDFGLSVDFRSFMQSAVRRWLENAGFLKERTGGDAPFVMRGLLRTYMDHLDQSSKIIHLAIPVRDAAAVLLDPRTVQAINKVHGSDMNEMLQKHLIEASMINQDTDGGPDRRLRTIHSLAIGSWLATNVGTFFRQIGSVFRIAARMPVKYFTIGLKGLAPGTYAEMKQHSGNFWNRYEGDSYARFSPMRGQGLSGMDFSAFGQSFGAVVRSIRALDRRSSSRSWASLMRSIKLLDWFDAIAARIAWAGRKAQVQDENPAWNEAKVLEETSRRSFDDIRSTANTSSANDSASLAVSWRNSPWRYFLLFTTDPNKSLNFLVRSWHESPTQGFRASLGVAGNILWSAYVVNIGLQVSSDVVASLIGAAFDLDPDEAERERQRIRTWERSHLRMATEVLGLSFFGDEVVNAVVAVSQPFRRDDVFRAPIGQVISDLALGGGEIGASIFQAMRNLEDGLTDEEKDKFAEDFIDGMLRSSKSASTLIGNPFLMPWYRVKPIKDQLFPEEEEDEARGDLAPEIR